jgi:DNA repair photolyase
MKVIYEPKGAAYEYAELACNLYSGCNHGCLYCYVPGCRHLTREQFHSDVRAYPDILKRLERDADKLAAAGDTRRVLFSFTSDPYQDFPRGVDVTREALQIMVDRGLPCEVCTKGGLRAYRDFDLLTKGGRLGVSLVWSSEFHREDWEPEAESLVDRRASLRTASLAGIHTWVSVEPVIRPNEALAAISSSADYVTEFRVGKVNHDKALEAAVDWQEFVDDAYELLLQTGRRFMFKDSLKPYLRGRPATGPGVAP